MDSFIDNMQDNPPSVPTPVDLPLNAVQEARMQRNKRRALELRQAQLASCQSFAKKSQISQGGGHLIDTGAGFFLDDTGDEYESTLDRAVSDSAPCLVHGKDDDSFCEKCEKPFMDSFLLKNFHLEVCDNCRDREGEHSLITRTEAKREFCLQDFQLDRLQPVLRFILRKNPHNSHWGDMKLYLRKQIEKRALEVWGSLDAIDDEKFKRRENQENNKQKKFEKQVQALRRSVVSSSWRQSQQSVHEHVYPEPGKPGGETYDQASDTYSSVCMTCGHRRVYEKL